MASSWQRAATAEDASSSGADAAVLRRRAGAVRCTAAGACLTLLAGAACGVVATRRGPPEQGLRGEALVATSLAEVSCSAKDEECSDTRCCSTPGTACYAKDEKYAICWEGCDPGIHETDPEEFRSPWSCDILEPAETTMVSEPFDCDAGFNNWKAGWSEAKKSWCCENKQRSCPGDPLPSKQDAAASASPSAAPSPPVKDGGCLCLFDVDRTLTSKQSESCGQEVPGVTDTAFGGGQMRLSEVGQNLGATACGACERGIISAGAADGVGEREVLARQIGVPDTFSPAGAVNGRLVFGCGNGQKQVAAQDILKWLESTQGVRIDPGNVYFFDDLGENIPGFADAGMNAHQISCGGRDNNGELGLCGATVSEIRLEKGITMC